MNCQDTPCRLLVRSMNLYSIRLALDIGPSRLPVQLKCAASWPPASGGDRDALGSGCRCRSRLAEGGLSALPSMRMIFGSVKSQLHISPFFANEAVRPEVGPEIQNLRRTDRSISLLPRLSRQDPSYHTATEAPRTQSKVFRSSSLYYSLIPWEIFARQSAAGAFRLRVWATSTHPTLLLEPLSSWTNFAELDTRLKIIQQD